MFKQGAKVSTNRDRVKRDGFNTPSKPKDNSVDLAALELAKNNRHKGWARRWLKEHGHWF